MSFFLFSPFLLNQRFGEFSPPSSGSINQYNKISHIVNELNDDQPRFFTIFLYWFIEPEESGKNPRNVVLKGRIKKDKNDSPIKTP